MRARWRDITERTARAFIRAAKNERYRPEQILQRLESGDGGLGEGKFPISNLQFTSLPCCG
jgi:hypothetical protein